MIRPLGLGFFATFVNKMTFLFGGHLRIKLRIKQHLSLFNMKKFYPSSHKDYQAIRQKLRRGTATEKDIEFYKWLGADPSKVKRETPEQREARLAKERARSAQRKQHETPKQGSRRREADRVRKKLRRCRCADDAEFQQCQDTLRGLCNYSPHFPQDYCGWWKQETIEEATKRKLKQTRHQYEYNRRTR